jgi:hypothetical protein
MVVAGLMDRAFTGHFLAPLIHIANLSDHAKHDLKELHSGVRLVRISYREVNADHAFIRGKCMASVGMRSAAGATAIRR